MNELIFSDFHSSPSACLYRSIQSKEPQLKPNLAGKGSICNDILNTRVIILFSVFPHFVFTLLSPETWSVGSTQLNCWAPFQMLYAKKANRLAAFFVSLFGFRHLPSPAKSVRIAFNFSPPQRPHKSVLFHWAPATDITTLEHYSL